MYLLVWASATISPLPYFPPVESIFTIRSNINIGGSGQTVNVSVVSTRDNLVPTLDIVTDLLRNPVFPEAEFAKLRDETLAYARRLEEADVPVSEYVLPAPTGWPQRA